MGGRERGVTENGREGGIFIFVGHVKSFWAFAWPAPVQIVFVEHLDQEVGRRGG